MVRVNRRSPLSAYRADIIYLLNDMHFGPKEIGDYLHQTYHLDRDIVHPKKISDHISYLKKNKLIPTPAVNAANGNMAALGQLVPLQLPGGCTQFRIVNTEPF